MPKIMACIICGKDVEGELKLRQGWLCYDKGGFGGVTHRHNTPEFYEIRSRNKRNKPKAVEQALERLLLHPDDAKALNTLHEWRARKLFELATDPGAGMAGIRAAEQLLAEFVGEPKPEQPKIVLHSDGRIVPTEPPVRDIVVHLLPEAEPKPQYKSYEAAEDGEPIETAEVWEELEPQWEERKLSNYVLRKPKPENPFGALLRDWGE